MAQQEAVQYVTRMHCNALVLHTLIYVLHTLIYYYAISQCIATQVYSAHSEK
jgi:hypothetical protein